MSCKEASCKALGSIGSDFRFNAKCFGFLQCFPAIWLYFSESKLNQENKSHCKYLIQTEFDARNGMHSCGRAEKPTGVVRKPEVSKVRKPQVQRWRDTGRRHCCWCPQIKVTWRATWEELEPLMLTNMHLRQKGRGRNILVYLYFHPPISRQCLPLSKSIRKPVDTEAGTWSLHKANLLAI